MNPGLLTLLFYDIVYGKKKKKKKVRENIGWKKYYI